MEGFSSNLNDTFTSTRGCAEPMSFPQHILPLFPLYNAQWWGYESLTAIALVFFVGHLFRVFRGYDYLRIYDHSKIVIQFSNVAYHFKSTNSIVHAHVTCRQTT